MRKMEQSEVTGQAQVRGAATIGAAKTVPNGAESLPPAKGIVPAQVGALPCPTCAGTADDGAAIGNNLVYALGQIEARFPRLSVEKEMAQATGQAETAGRTDKQAFHGILAKRENRYLARQMCWVLSIRGLETYLLQPRDALDFDLLIQAIEPQPQPRISTVIGIRGPVAPPEYCNGLMVPIVVFDQLYTFSGEALIGAIPRPRHVEEEKFAPAAREVFDRIMLMTDNAGSSDNHRALNYLSVRYPAIYAKAAEQFAKDFTLTAVETRASPLGLTRKIVEVIFVFTNRVTDFTEKFFVRVDVTETFPFLVTKLSPYYDL
jgi:hypothetical protein